MNDVQRTLALSPALSPKNIGEREDATLMSTRVIRRRSVYADKLLAFPEFVFSDGGQLSRRDAWDAFFAARLGPTFDGRVIFEVGCNDAALLARVAARHPTTAFIGVDWKCRALHTAAERVSAEGLRNIALLHGRAQDVQRIFAEREIDEVWIFHPEPCDKPRELANRLISEPFLSGVHGVLRDGGSLVLKTDHLAYYQGSLDDGQALADQFDLVASSADFWNDAPLQRAIAGRGFAGESSAFEDRYRRKHRPIYYLEWRKR
jgi:tRNA G46 methylase TrmB